MLESDDGLVFKTGGMFQAEHETKRRFSGNATTLIVTSVVHCFPGGATETLLEVETTPSPDRKQNSAG